MVRRVSCSFGPARGLSRPLALAFALLAATPAAAESFLPAPDLVDQALDSHPMVAHAEARLRAATAEARQLAVGEHEVIATAVYTRRDIDQAGRYNEWDGTLSRAFRLPGKARLDREAGRLGIEAQENALDDARHQTALLLAGAWLDWVGAEAQAALDAEDVRAWEQERAAMARRVALKDAAPLDLDLIDAGLARARAALAQTSGMARQARATLARQFPELPLPPAAPAIDAPALPDKPLAAWFDTIIARSHELHYAELEARRLAVVANRRERDQWADPSIGVRAFSERGGEETGVGLVLTVPLGGGYRRATTDVARAEASAATADLARTRREIETIADRDVARVEASFAGWQRAAEAATAGAAALTRLRRGYELGDRDLADLLAARRQQQEVARAELLARAEAQAALLRLRIDAHDLWVRPHAGHSD